jgi:hypothetical protein
MVPVMAATAGLTLLAAKTPVVPADLTLPATFRATMMILDQQPKGTVKVSGAGEGSDGGVVVIGDGGTTVGVGSNGVATPSSSVGTFPAPAKGGRPIGNSAFVSITLRRLSTDDENLKHAASQRTGGISALIGELEKSDLGQIRLDTEIPWRIRAAATWAGPEGQVVRFVTTGRLFAPKQGAGPDASPIVNIVEFRLAPGERYGEGTLVSATQVDFPEPGRIVPRTLVIGSGTQRLTNVERTSAKDTD